MNCDALPIYLLKACQLLKNKRLLNDLILFALVGGFVFDDDVRVLYLLKTDISVVLFLMPVSKEVG